MGTWFIAEIDDNSKSSLIDAKINFRLDSNVFFAYVTPSVGLRIEEVYSLGDQIIQRHIGVWGKSRSALTWSTEEKWKRRMNLMVTFPTK